MWTIRRTRRSWVRRLCLGNDLSVWLCQPAPLKGEPGYLGSHSYLASHVRGGAEQSEAERSFPRRDAIIGVRVNRYAVPSGRRFAAPTIINADA